MQPKLWSIQVLRFVAAAMVVHVHTAQRAHDLLGDAGVFGRAGELFGRCGVDLFFVISGLIIWRTGSDLPAGEFLAKRARRILPMYGLVAAPCILWAITRGDFAWRDALASFALWPATDQMTAPKLRVGWTLCYEALFYVSFALVLWRRWAVLPLLAVLGLGLILPGGAVLQYVGNPLVLEFLLGVLLAQLPPTRSALWGIPVGLAILIAGAALNWGPFGGGGTDFLSGVDAWVRLFDCGIPAALIVWGVLQIEWRQGLLTELGDASYSIYLTHPAVVVVVVLLCRKFIPAPADVTILFASAISIIVGWRIHVLVEKPLQRFLAQRSRRLVPATA